MSVVDRFRWYAHDIEVNDFQIRIDGTTYGVVIDDLDSKKASALIGRNRETLNTLYNQVLFVGADPPL